MVVRKREQRIGVAQCRLDQALAWAKDLEEIAALVIAHRPPILGNFKP